MLSPHRLRAYVFASHSSESRFFAGRVRASAPSWHSTRESYWWPSYGSLPTRVQALCWSRPHPGRRQSQYSWAHMDPSAHSLAFRGGAEVPRPSTAKVQSYNARCMEIAKWSRRAQLPTPRTPTTDEEQSYASRVQGPGRIATHPESQRPTRKA